MPTFLLTALLDWRTWLFVGVMAGAGWLYHAGAKSAQAKIAVATARYEAEKAIKEAAATASAAAIREALEGRKTEIKTVTRDIIKEVPIYVTTAADSACVVPAGFVQLHDDAARLSRFPAAAGGSGDAPSGIPLSGVGSAVAANYGSAHELAAEVRAWRDWYAKQREIMARKSP